VCVPLVAGLGVLAASLSNCTALLTGRYHVVCVARVRAVGAA
jgi:hypothetical protein